MAALADGYRQDVTDLNPRAQQQAQTTIQQIVDAVAAEHTGDEDVDRVRAALADRLAAAGLPEQPQTWVSDTAAEIAGGRRLVVDRALRDDDDPERRGGGR